jgi:hypothetical protein
VLYIYFQLRAARLEAQRHRLARGNLYARKYEAYETPANVRYDVLCGFTKLFAVLVIFVFALVAENPGALNGEALGRHVIRLTEADDISTEKTVESALSEARANPGCRLSSSWSPSSPSTSFPFLITFWRELWSRLRWNLRKACEAAKTEILESNLVSNDGIDGYSVDVKDKKCVFIFFLEVFVLIFVMLLL